VSDNLVLAPWMCPSLPTYWPDHPHYVFSGEPKVECQESSSPLIFSGSKIPVKKMTTQLGGHVSSLFGLMKQRVKQKEKPLTQSGELELSREEKPPETTPLIQHSKTLIVQATQYLVEAQKEGQLPHQIAVEEFNAAATEIVRFVELIAAQVSRRAKISGIEILDFSQDTLFSRGANNGSKPIDTNSFIEPGQRKDIFRLAQGALVYINKHLLFSGLQDEKLYSQCVTKLTAMVMRGVENEASVVGAKKKGLSF